MAPTSDALVASLSTEIDRTLAPLLPPGTAVALLNFPNHGNPGDPAIWLGERRALSRLGVDVEYRAEWSTYDPATLARVLPDGPILLNGGGNLGDRYQGQQQTRERVLGDFSGRPVIQLPQSIEFLDPSRSDQMARLVQQHGAFTLLARDEQSLSYARDHFDATTRLCPDMAFALERLDRPVSPTSTILWLARSDSESTHRAIDGEPDVEVTDWWPPPPHPRPLGAKGAWEANRALRALLGRPRRGVGRLWPALAATFDPLAEHWVQEGVRTIARGEVVVTDRLHGHVFALLLGIPHVLLDNATGKVRSMYETFTSSSPLVHWAATPEQALETARGLAAP